MRHRRSRPKVAALASVYHYLSHAYHIVGRFLDGFAVHDGRRPAPAPTSRSPACSSSRSPPRPTSAAPRPQRHGVRLSPTIADALTLGTGKLAVDAVLLIAEHGDYPLQREAPEALSRGAGTSARCSTSSGRRAESVPVFIDKHLSYSRAEAPAMVEAGAGAERPADGRLEPAGHLAAARSWRSRWAGSSTRSLVASRGDLEIFGFHALETLQCMAERRDREGQAAGRRRRDLPGR